MTSRIFDIYVKQPLSNISDKNLNFSAEFSAQIRLPEALL